MPPAAPRWLMGQTPPPARSSSVPCAVAEGAQTKESGWVTKGNLESRLKIMELEMAG